MADARVVRQRASGVLTHRWVRRGSSGGGTGGEQPGWLPYFAPRPARALPVHHAPPVTTRRRPLPAASRVGASSFSARTTRRVCQKRRTLHEVLVRVPQNNAATWTRTHPVHPPDHPQLHQVLCCQLQQQRAIHRVVLERSYVLWQVQRLQELRYAVHAPAGHRATGLPLRRVRPACRWSGCGLGTPSARDEHTLDEPQRAQADGKQSARRQRILLR